MKDFIIFLFFAGTAWLVWRAFAAKPTPAEQQKEDPQTRHMKSALQFAQAQHKTLTKQQREQDAWQQEYGHAKASELDQLGSEEFEYFLAGLYRAQGYAAEHTAVTGDYGADLILSKDGQRICVQAKRYAGGW